MYAERNRKIKQVLSQAFGAGKVTVRGSRGTATGWVSISIAYAPKNAEESRELTAKVWELFRAAKINIGTYGYDDPGSDYGHGAKMHLYFLQCRDVFNERERVCWNGRTGTIKDRDYRSGGDWYTVQWDGEQITHLFHKNDLARESQVAA